LLLIFLLRSRGSFRPVGWLMVLALVFCTMGDIGLLMEKTDGRGMYFLAGIGAFGLAQLSYIAAFHKAGTELRVRRHRWIFIPMLGYGVTLLFILWPSLPEALRLPVIGYAILLISMALTVFHRVHRSALLPALEGAVFFILSDSLIAFNRFVTDVPLGGPLIMGMYVVGQYLLVRGFITQMKYKEALINPSVVESPGGTNQV
jgi:uncharacterized membrane protein YhhN